MMGDAKNLRSHHPQAFYDVNTRVSFLLAGYQPLDFLSLQHSDSLMQSTVMLLNLEGIGVGWECLLENGLKNGSGPTC